jgi:F0F1-type ATP synthase membrane subunit a
LESQFKIKIFPFQKREKSLFGLFAITHIFEPGLLLVPIEEVSFLFKLLSLLMPLFANRMAGHTLLKVICSFAWIIIIKGGYFFGLQSIHLKIKLNLCYYYY